MIKSSLTLAAIFFTTASFAQSDVATANWAGKIKVDGDPAEWSQPLRFYDNSSKLFYSFVNDDKNLYICFETDDEADQAKIMRSGMRVSLAIKGKDKHKVSIDFPVTEKMDAPAEDAPKAPGQKFDRDNFKAAFLLHHTTMDIKGFVTKDGIISITDSSGINAAINWDATNRLVYEIAIPLKELYGVALTTDDITKDIALTAEVHAIKRTGSDDKAYSGKAGGANRMGGAGRMGGGMGGHGGRGGGHNNNTTENNTDEKVPDEVNTQRTSLYEKSEVKQRFTLAIKQG